MRKNQLKQFLFVLICTIVGPTTILIAQPSQLSDKVLSLDLNGSVLKLTYYADQSLDEASSDFAHAVISIHGNNRNGDDYFESIKAAASLRPTFSDSTLLLAPQFLTSADLDDLGLGSAYLYWTSGGWIAGSNSRDEDTHPRPARVSSYAVLDSMIWKLSQNFSELKTITITGHSAGGQFVNRYAATSLMPDLLCKSYDIQSKFVVANPSSYLYLNERRAVSGTIDSFQVPATSCTGYNEWKYGLDELFSYPSMAGVDSIRRMYQRREVVYLAGGADNDPNASSLDTSCEGMLQGQHRLERATIYYNYIKSYYGDGVTSRHMLDTVPLIGHNNADMYASEKGLFHLFEHRAKSCENAAEPPVLSVVQSQLNAKIYPNPAESHFIVEATERIQSVTVHDLNGKLVSHHLGENRITLHISDIELTAGLYWILIHHSKGVNHHRLIVR